VIEVLAAAVLIVVLACAAAAIGDAHAQRRLEDQAARRGSRHRHPSYVRKLRKPYDWERD